MAVNLVELVKGYLTPDIVQKAASFVGESESATQKAMNGIVPTLIAALANQASTSGGAEKLSRILEARTTVFTQSGVCAGRLYER